MIDWWGLVLLAVLVAYSGFLPRHDWLPYVPMLEAIQERRARRALPPPPVRAAIEATPEIDEDLLVISVEQVRDRVSPEVWAELFPAPKPERPASRRRVHHEEHEHDFVEVMSGDGAVRRYDCSCGACYAPSGADIYAELSTYHPRAARKELVVAFEQRGRMMRKLADSWERDEGGAFVLTTEDHLRYTRLVTEAQEIKALLRAIEQSEAV